MNLCNAELTAGDKAITGSNTSAAKPQNTLVYPVEEYLDDVFAMVWKPQSDSYRRFQQRAYVDFLGYALNGNNGTSGASATTGGAGTTVILRTDAILYIEQHLDKVENYLKAQPTDGLNGQHVKNLLLRIKKIRETYTNGRSPN